MGYTTSDLHHDIIAASDESTDMLQLEMRVCDAKSVFILSKHHHRIVSVATRDKYGISTDYILEMKNYTVSTNLEYRREELFQNTSVLIDLRSLKIHDRNDDTLSGIIKTIINEYNEGGDK